MRERRKESMFKHGFFPANNNVINYRRSSGMDSNIDYSKYTLDELIDVRNNIDKDTYPDRFNEVNWLITEQMRYFIVQIA